MATTLSDVDALLQASASPSGNAGTILAAPIAVTPSVSPVPGGAILPTNTEKPQVNIATVGDVSPDGSGFDTKALLWVGAGIGTAWLLSRSGGSVSGPKNQKWLVPGLILGAGVAWYFFGDKITAAASPATATPSGGGSSVTDTQRADLRQWGNGNPKVIAVINSADAGTIDIWSRLLGMWDRNAATQELYSTYPNGTTGAPWDKSIGKWWENFKLQNSI